MELITLVYLAIALVAGFMIGKFSFKGGILFPDDFLKNGKCYRLVRTYISPENGQTVLAFQKAGLKDIYEQKTKKWFFIFHGDNVKIEGSPEINTVYMVNVKYNNLLSREDFILSLPIPEKKATKVAT